MVLLSALLEILRKPNILEVLGELFLFIAPLWIAVIIGVLVGWAWKPKWVNLVGSDMYDVSVSKQDSSSSSPISSTCFASVPSLNCFKFQFPSCMSWNSDDRVQKEAQSNPSSAVSHYSSSYSEFERENSTLVAKDDLESLCRLVEEKDGGPAWIEMMDRSTPTMGYKAWRRDPPIGPPQYRSRTVFENATPELVRDFFWDDEFRLKWDDMLMHASILEECPSTGTMVMHWVRKFPFFCSDREYIIGRRIWESGRSYYCVTKGVPCSTVPRRDKPRRVDLYYSSWCIRAVESKSGDGQLTSCEVLLFHHEDMGIPWEIAKFGVRQGMWGAVRKIEPGLRAYQKDRASGIPISRCSFMAGVNTKVSADYLSYLENANGESSEVGKLDSPEKPLGRNIPKLVVIGGVIALACSLDRGLLTKAVIFGVARRFAKIGRRL